jgi:aspartate/methionine/tyrosine aminotransferase
MLAKRVQYFTESVIREMTRLAHDYGAINLGQGMPDFETPQEIKDAACKAIQDGFNQYSVTWGNPSLRQAIAAKASRFNGIDCDPDTSVTVCCGATECMMATMLALVDPGAEVVVFQPFYENYGPDTALSGAKPVWVPLHPPDWRFDPDELRRAFTKQTRAIIINTPNNPTGRVFTRDELSFIAGLCQEFDAYAFADEIYEHILYVDRPHVSIATLPGMAERTVTVSGLSKTFSITGWRLGYCLAPPEMTAGIRKVHDFLTVGAPHPLQVAGAAALALPASYYAKLHADYVRRREIFLPYLRDAGFDFTPPEGAYYVVADFSRLSQKDDVAFARYLTKDIGVSAIPGSSFYSPRERGQSKVRFMFAKRDEILHQAGAKLLKLRQ